MMVSSESERHSNPDGRQDLTLQDIKPLNFRVRVASDALQSNS